MGEEEKNRKQKGEQKKQTGKSSSEEKGVCFSSASLFAVRKQEAVTQGGTREIDHPPDAEENPGS